MPGASAGNVYLVMHTHTYIYIRDMYEHVTVPPSSFSPEKLRDLHRKRKEEEINKDQLAARPICPVADLLQLLYKTCDKEGKRKERGARERERKKGV